MMFLKLLICVNLETAGSLVLTDSKTHKIKDLRKAFKIVEFTLICCLLKMPLFLNRRREVAIVKDMV